MALFDPSAPRNYNQADTIYGTAPQIEFAREMAKALLKGQRPDTAHLQQPNAWMNIGSRELLSALSGAQYRDIAGRQDIKNVKESIGGQTSNAVFGRPVLQPKLNLGKPSINVASLTPSGAEKTIGEKKSTNISMGDDQRDRAKIAFDYFISQGWSPAQSAGLIANIQHESSFNHQLPGDNGKSWGIAQWNGPRRNELAKFAGKPADQTSFEEQLAFMHYELTKGGENKVGEMLKGVTDPSIAGGIVSSFYERPAKDQFNTRGATAKNMFDKYGVETGSIPSAAKPVASPVVPPTNGPTPPDPARLPEGTDPAEDLLKGRSNLGGPKPTDVAEGGKPFQVAQAAPSQFGVSTDVNPQAATVPGVNQTVPGYEGPIPPSPYLETREQLEAKLRSAYPSERAAILDEYQKRAREGMTYKTNRGELHVIPTPGGGEPRVFFTPTAPPMEPGKLLPGYGQGGAPSLDLTLPTGGIGGGKEGMAAIGELEGTRQAAGEKIAGTQAERTKRYADLEGDLQRRSVGAQVNKQMLSIARSMVNDPSFYSGVGANRVLDYKKIASYLTGNPQWSGSSEAFSKLIAGANIAGLEAFKGYGQIRNPEIELLREASGTSANTPGALNAIIDINERASERLIEIGEKMREYRAQHGYLDKNFDKEMASFYKNRPMFADKEIEEFRDRFKGTAHILPWAKYTNASKVTNDEEYNALPSGSVFIGPDGKRRKKP